MASMSDVQTFSGPSAVLTFTGPPGVPTFSGPSAVLTFNGPPDVQTFSGPSSYDTGPLFAVLFEPVGTLSPMDTLSQAYIPLIAQLSYHEVYTTLDPGVATFCNLRLPRR